MADTMIPPAATVELCDELRGSVRTARGVTFLAHPLVHTLYHPAMNDSFNALVAQKQKALEDARRRKDWPEIIFLDERPYRLTALVNALAASRAAGTPITGVAYWTLVRSVWRDTEDVHTHRAAWMRLLRSTEPGNHESGEAEDEAMRAALPEQVRLYRGAGNREARPGLSWTTDPARARWFATRFESISDGTPTLYMVTVPRTAIRLTFASRNESECVVLPDYTTRRTQEVL